jgi:ribosomal protein S30
MVGADQQPLTRAFKPQIPALPAKCQKKAAALFRNRRSKTAVLDARETLPHTFSR